MVLFLMLFSVPAFAQEAKEPLEPYSPPQAEGRPYSSFKQQEQKATPKTKMREPNVEMWLPPDFQKSVGPWPLIVFSHGFGGCAKQSVFLTSYLAENGYIVIAPDHVDADCSNKTGTHLGSMQSAKKSWPEKPFRNPESWTDKTEADRKDDVLFALSSMFDDRQYAKFVDKKRIGLMGHSLGGYTVLGLAGAWPSWKDKRFKAVLAMSPYIGPYLASGGLKRVHVPVMYQGGTRDNAITPDLRKRAYPQAQVPKYYIELDGADHYAWTELEYGYQDIIRRTSLAFFDKYLKDEKIHIDEAEKPKIKVFLKDEGLK